MRIPIPDQPRCWRCNRTMYGVRWTPIPPLTWCTRAPHGHTC